VASPIESRNMDSETASTEDDEDRDARLLRQLALVGDRDPLIARQLQGQLLAPYRKWARGIAAYRLHALRLGDEELDDIANRLLKRLADAIAKGELTKPLLNVAFDNIDWEIKDFYKRRRKTKLERLEDPHDLSIANEPGDVPSASLNEEAAAFRARIAELPDRQRRILTERLFLGRKPADIAKDLGMTRGALDTDYSRALARLRVSDAMADVRKQIAEADRDS